MKMRSDEVNETLQPHLDTFVQGPEWIVRIYYNLDVLFIFFWHDLNNFWEDFTDGFKCHDLRTRQSLEQLTQVVSFPLVQTSSWRAGH